MAASDKEVPYRIGSGFDCHRLVPGRPLWLGGVEIPAEKGCLGHSDGDALLHALADAILGAAGMDDLGVLFPDNDPKYKDAKSGDLLRTVLERVKQRGFRVINADITIILEAPKISSHRSRIRQSVASLLEIPLDRISVKGKTAEGLGPIGSGDAVVAMATVLLVVGA